MKPVRVLVLSGSRPSRSWKIAERIRREIPGAEITGVIQAQLLAPAQQWMAQGADPCSSSSGIARPARWLRSILHYVLNWVLWFVHGCPRELNSVKTFTVADLAEKCRQIRCGFLVAESFDSTCVNQFIQDHADLVIVLGEAPLDPRRLAIPQSGVVRAYQGDAVEAVKTRQNVRIDIQVFSQHSESPCTLVSLALPVQPHDGPLGLTLKADLIADDLLLESVKILKNEASEQVSKKLKDWLQQTIAPYLAQLESMALENAPAPPPLQRFRRLSRLLLDSVLLCSPFLIARNWYSRCRRRYPVLILTHHLVSDRPHRMGISTERFWRQLQFLQRHYRLLSMADAEELLRAGEVDVPTAVVTFDDGYRDNFINLRAVADEMGVPVVLFVATKPVEDEREFQHDLVDGRSGHPALTWSQILFWQGRGAEFGSHTRTHLDCATTDRTILKEEIVGSKLDLEDRLGKEIRFFAFPFGQLNNMSVEAMEIASSAYAVSLTGLDGENFPFEGKSAVRLFRKDLYPSCWELELELQSIFLLINRCREKLRFKRPRLRKLAGKSLAYPCSPSGQWLSAGPKED